MCHPVLPTYDPVCVRVVTGMGLASCDVPITRAVFDTLANHYPERMGVLWMYDAPFVFWGLWKVSLYTLRNLAQQRQLSKTVNRYDLRKENLGAHIQVARHVLNLVMILTMNLHVSSSGVTTNVTNNQRNVRDGNLSLLATPCCQLL